MSFVDLATLTMYRRNELENRIKQFSEKCDHAINEIMKLKAKSKGLVLQLNCDPSELKERFLNSMKLLDEYTYVLTDFNLVVDKLEETGSTDYTPVQDTTLPTLLPTPIHPFNLLDALSEPTPSTSTAMTVRYPPEKPKRVKRPKEDQILIQFSSTSCSSESVAQCKQDVTTKEVQCQITEDLKDMSLKDRDETAASVPESPTAGPAERSNLPAQTLLEVDQKYKGTIMHVDGAYFWVITDDIEDVYSLMTEMTEYYSNNHHDMCVDEVKSLAYCAFFDDECYYRGLFLKIAEDDAGSAEVFVVDTGETRRAALAHVQPLRRRFSAAPPYARCCHLAGVDLTSYQNDSMLLAFEDFMRNYIGVMCVIEVDDNTSESLGVYVTLQNNKKLNDIIIKEKLAYAIDKSVTSPASAEVSVDPELDISQCPEYEDPVEAVTGYHNRDEADICKHYKGGPETTCYKGARCNKKHVVKHPDGWTLDRVEVRAKCRTLPLPAPDSWHKVRVTHVCHFDRLYVHLVNNHQRADEIPEFGVILPPMTLESLVEDMNSPAARCNYKQLKITPAPGELVAALYPLDNNWYRARVVTVTRADQNVEVIYIDYGTTMWVKEDQVKVLEARYCRLAAQALRCKLAGVRARSHLAQHWAAAKHALAQRTQQAIFNAHVISRDYDEITVELFDEDGYNIAEEFAAQKLIDLEEYSVDFDNNVQQKIVVP